MTKIIKLKEGDEVPDGARFLYTINEEKFVKGERYLQSDWILWKTYVTPMHRELTTYFYYEVKISNTQGGR